MLTDDDWTQATGAAEPGGLTQMQAAAFRLQITPRWEAEQRAAHGCPLCPTNLCKVPQRNHSRYTSCLRKVLCNLCNQTLGLAEHAFCMNHIRAQHGRLCACDASTSCFTGLCWLMTPHQAGMVPCYTRASPSNSAGSIPENTCLDASKADPLE